MGKPHTQPAQPRAPRDDEARTALTIFLTVAERRAALRALRALAHDRRVALLRALSVDPEAPRDA